MAVKELEGRGLYKPDLLYRAFSRKRLKKMLKTGTDRDLKSKSWDAVSSLTPEKILYADSEENALGHNLFSVDKKGFVLAVYDPEDLEEVYSSDRGNAYRIVSNVRPIAIIKMDTRKVGPSSLSTIERLAKEKREFKEKHSHYSGNKGLENSLTALLIIGIIGGLFFLFPNITGNVIGNLTQRTSNFVGGILLAVGLVAGFLWIEKNKKKQTTR